jgi:myo-inositol catabolism protein IolS
MQYRRVGTTDIMVSHVGFGCWTMGGPNWSTRQRQPIGWADVNDDDVLAGIKVGLDAGVNHWDNADIYGNGKRRAPARPSASARLGVKRDTQVIATKVGHFKGTAPHAYDPAAHPQPVRAIAQEPRHRLHRHLLLPPRHVRRPGVRRPPHDYLHEAAATMHALVKEGKVRAIGQSAYGDADFVRAVPVLKPDVLQNKANLRPTTSSARQRAPDPHGQHGCSFVAFGPLDQGILLDKFDPANPPKFDEGDSRGNRRDMTAESLFRVREKLTKLAAHFGFASATGDARIAAFSSVASRWVLAHPHVSSVIPGFRNARQATCNIAAGSAEPMSPTDVAFVRALFAE